MKFSFSLNLKHLSSFFTNHIKKFLAIALIVALGYLFYVVWQYVYKVSIEQGLPQTNISSERLRISKENLEAIVEKIENRSQNFKNIPTKNYSNPFKPY